MDLYYIGGMPCDDDVTSELPVWELAIETSGPLGGVALGRNGLLVDERVFTEPRTQARYLVPSVADICDAHQVTPNAIRRVYVSAGPGSFTGLRIGIAAARTLALAVGSRCVGVPSLQVVAQNALDLDESPLHVAVIQDAKRGRVYASTFVSSGGVYRAVDEPREVDPESYLSACPASCAVMGEGVRYHKDAVKAAGVSVLPDEFFTPRARTVLRLGVELGAQQTGDQSQTLVPVYIRPPEAEEKWRARQPHGR